MSKYMSFITSPSSAAHTYGNVTAFVTEKIKSWFHPDFFKTVNISSTIASHNFRLLRNTMNGTFKKEKPYLVVVPKASFESDLFLNNTLMTNRYSEDVPAFDSGNLFTFIEDREKGLHVKYIVNRDKITFDVGIYVETAMLQLNIAKMMRNRVLTNKPLTWQTYLECQVPREVMAGVSYIGEVPLTEPVKVLQYANSHSDSPVTYMMKNSTGNDEYFKYYGATIDALISEFNLSDGNKKGMTDDYYTINFTVEVEFFTIGEYFVYTDHNRAQIYQSSMRDFVFDSQMDLDGALSKDALGDLQIIFTPYEDVGIDIQPGWKVVAESSFKVEKKRPDIIPFKSIVNPRLQDIIKWHLDKGITLDKLIDIHVMKDNKLMDKVNGDYTIDFETLELYVYNISYLSTYRLIIVMNNLYVNELAIQDIGKVQN